MANPRMGTAFAMLSLMVSATIAQGATWAPAGGDPNAAVSALAADSTGAVYAGGEFTAIGGASMGRVGRWDGTSWSSMGGGLNGPVRAIAVDGSGNVYAAGEFSATAGGTQVSHVARWNGTAWVPMGPGLNADVYALATDTAGNVYAGGVFTGTGGGGGSSLSRIAKWDGTSWSALGTGVTWPAFPTSPSINALVVNAVGDLYAGGNFDTAGGVPASYLARWDGTSWSAVGVGVAGTVNALAMASDGSLYVGGVFVSLGPPAWTSAIGIARWNGTTWSAAGGGVGSSPGSPAVYALAPDPSGGMYAGGSFTVAGGSPAGMLARWTGSSWTMPGPWMSTDSLVSAVVRDAAGTLYAGGTLVTAPGAATTHLARLLPDATPPATGGAGGAGGAGAAAGNGVTKPRKLAGSWVFNTKTRVGTTSGTVPAGATAMVQTVGGGGGAPGGATATQGFLEMAKAKTASGKCRITTVRNKKTRKVTRRTYRCTIRLSKGTWTVTTTARGKAGVVAEGSRRVVVR